MIDVNAHLHPVRARTGLAAPRLWCVCCAVGDLSAKGTATLSAVNTLRIAAWGLLGMMTAAGCGQRCVSIFEHSFAAADLAVLHLDQRAGSLVIVGEVDRGQITVVAELHAGRSSERDDDAAKDALRIGLLAIDDTQARILAGLDAAPDHYQLDVRITVPARMVMFVEDTEGAAEIEGIGGVSLWDTSGDVAIRSIAGDVRLFDEGGAVVISDVDGVLEVTDGSGPLDIAGVTERAEIHDGSGDLTVRGVGGPLTVDDGSGDLDIGGVAGLVQIRDGAGDIVVRDAPEVEIVSDGSGTVDIP